MSSTTMQSKHGVVRSCTARISTKSSCAVMCTVLVLPPGWHFPIFLLLFIQKRTTSIRESSQMSTNQTNISTWLLAINDPITHKPFHSEKSLSSLQDNPSPTPPKKKRIQTRVQQSSKKGNDHVRVFAQLTFDTFTVGRFLSFTSDGCPDGYMSISEEARPATGGQWCGSAWGYTVYYSETRSINLTLYLSRLSGQVRLSLSLSFCLSMCVCLSIQWHLCVAGSRAIQGSSYTDV